MKTPGFTAEVSLNKNGEYYGACLSASQPIYNGPLVRPALRHQHKIKSDDPCTACIGDCVYAGNDYDFCQEICRSICGPGHDW